MVDGMAGNPVRQFDRAQSGSGVAALWTAGSEWRDMADSGGLVLRVNPGPDDDSGELAELTGLLRAELLDLDVVAVERHSVGVVPAGAKGVAAVANWLAVQLGTETLRSVLAKVADWAARNDRGVEVTYGGNTLKLTRATRDQQERIIDDWLARHPPGA